MKTNDNDLQASMMLLLKYEYIMLEKDEQNALRLELENNTFLNSLLIVIQSDRKNHNLNTFDEHLKFLDLKAEESIPKILDRISPGKKVYKEQNNKSEKVIIRSLRYKNRRLIVTAAILIGFLAVCFFGIKFGQGYQESEALAFNEPFKPDEMLGDPINPDYVTAMGRDDYQKAFEILQPLSKSKPDDHEIQFYYGICALEIYNYDLAIQKLTQTSKLQPEEFLYATNAHWYLGFAYLESGDREKALETFENLEQRENLTPKMKENLEEITRRLDSWIFF